MDIFFLKVLGFILELLELIMNIIIIISLVFKKKSKLN